MDSQCIYTFLSHMALPYLTPTTEIKRIGEQRLFRDCLYCGKQRFDDHQWLMTSEFVVITGVTDGLLMTCNDKKCVSTFLTTFVPRSLPQWQRTMLGFTE